MVGAAPHGGGYQFLAAFELLRTRGKPVLDAIAPEITWNDLNENLAPQGVPRTLWASALGAAALPPQGVEVTSDPCSRKLGGGDFQQLALRFFTGCSRGRGSR